MGIMTYMPTVGDIVTYTDRGSCKACNEAIKLQIAAGTVGKVVETAVNGILCTVKFKEVGNLGPYCTTCFEKAILLIEVTEEWNT